MVVGLGDHMTITFRAKVGEGPSEKLKNIKEIFGKKGVMFHCGEGEGHFRGMGLSGKYVRDGDEIEVTLYTVPPFTTFEMVAERIKKSLEGDDT